MAAILKRWNFLDAAQESKLNFVNSLMILEFPTQRARRWAVSSVLHLIEAGACRTKSQCTRCVKTGNAGRQQHRTFTEDSAFSASREIALRDAPQFFERVSETERGN